MTFSVFLHLIFTGLAGIHCRIHTVTVPVKAGGSISIPCFYEDKYKNYVKYLCKGENWGSCVKVIDTSQTTTGRYAIVDDTNQNIFTVTINDLTDKDGTFWCAIKIVFWSDVKQDFKLSVTSDSTSLYVEQQEITAVEKGSVTVICYYNNTKVMKWCRLSSTCVEQQLGQIDGTTVKLNSSVYGLFNVTMSELRTQSSGWYYCASENLQMPVHVSVYKSVTTTAVYTTTTTQSPNTTTFTGITESHTVHLINSTMNETEGVSLQNDHRSSMVTILVSTLLLQLLIVLAALIGWRMIKHKKTKPNESDISMEPQTPPDCEICYSTVVQKQPQLIQQEQNPTGSEIYNNINTYDNVAQMTAAPEGSVSVIYSTLQ